MSAGLLWPAGTSGGTCWYSQHNLDRLRRLAELLQAGLNLAGIALVLDLEHTTPGSAPTPASTRTTEHSQREQNRSGPRTTDRSRSWRAPGLASNQNALQVSASAHLLVSRR
jgi:MerR family transcriptional regulator/heat shock protein HspR